MKRGCSPLPLVRYSLLLAACLAPVCGATAAEPEHAAGLELFEKKIRPVLIKHCYECHSAQSKSVKGEFLLDNRAALKAGGPSGAAVVPGKPDESLLISALKHDGFEMPPQGKLPAAVIADFEKWISLGAPDPRDGEAAPRAKETEAPAAGRPIWSFQPPVRREPPQVADPNWPRDDIDRFLLHRLEQAGIAPAPVADRETLIRRVYYDLVGIPPKPAAVAEFLADDGADALEKVIDRLQATPQYGERWGRHWLDVARFAESSGGGRTLMFPDAWRYRDYVIRAMNEDRPYDRFIAEQVAGDLLPHDTPRQREDLLVASGLLVLGPFNYEQQDKELLRMDVVDEQLDTVGKAVLGLTIGCARCHDHKFDPISQRDYYAMAGFFRSTKTLTPGNVSGWVKRALPEPPEIAARRAAYEKRLAAAGDQLNLARGELKQLEAELAGKPLPADSAADGPVKLAGIVIDDAEAQRVGDWTASTFEPRYVGRGYVHDNKAGKGEKSITFQTTLPASGQYEVRFAYNASSGRAKNVPVTIRHADGETKLEVNQTVRPPIDGLLRSLGQFRFTKEQPVVVTIANAGTTGHVIADAVQLLPIGADGQPIASADSTDKVAKPKPAKPAGDEDRLARLAEQVKVVKQQIQEREATLAEVKKTAPPSPPVAMAVEDERQTEDCAINIRGNIRNLGEVVPRGFLSVAYAGKPPVIEEGASGRRQLAEWLVSRDNPLTARVAVNRIWHHLFGKGLVATTDNFGGAGALPSHPELLDTLAIEFMEDGWSRKRLIRRLMLTRAYAGSSAPLSEEATRLDPENRLLGRMNRRRMEAEVLRDAILDFSGQLDLTVGGSTTTGLRSEFGYKFTGVRRSVYVPVFRNTLHELFEVFDFADPNLPVGRRNTSVLPTQALYLMNSPWVMEQAEQAARRLLAEDVPGDAARIELAYRRALGRGPSAAERQLAEDYLARFVDQKEQDTPEQRELAAWSSLCQALMACVDFRYIN